jgi:hypothetical protein
MVRLPGSANLIARGRAAATLALGGLLLMAPPALAQNSPPPGSTINGTVPTAEGNVWNGLDHQPTPSEIAPVGNAQEQARINHKLSKLDQQLLNDPLPKLPPGAPTIQGN